MKEKNTEEKKNNLLFVLILLVIIISIFSTLIVLNSIDKAKQFFISQQTSTSGGKVGLTIVQNPDNPIITGEGIMNGRVVMNIEGGKK